MQEDFAWYLLLCVPYTCTNPYIQIHMVVRSYVYLIFQTGLSLASISKTEKISRDNLIGFLKRTIAICLKFLWCAKSQSQVKETYDAKIRWESEEVREKEKHRERGRERECALHTRLPLGRKQQREQKPVHMTEPRRETPQHSCPRSPEEPQPTPW